MNVPDYSTLAEAVFNSYPEDVKTLNAMCDQTEADRAEFGEDDPRVQAGERKVNNLKGLFTRRIAWACAQQDSRFGLRRKTSGAVATRSDGVQHSTDALMLRDDGQIIDCMSDRKWSWSVALGDTQPIIQWLAPLPPEGEPVPATTPVPLSVPPPPADTSDLVARIAALEERQRLDGPAVVRMIAELQQRCTKLEQAPAVTPASPELPKLVAVGKIHVFGYDYNVRFPVQKA